MLRYYVLVNKSLTRLIRQFDSLPVGRTVVVINSTHQPFVDVAIDYCYENSIEYYVTKSDGTPATGKNAMMQIFLQSNDEYMVAIDGDDFITPYGVKLYLDAAHSSKVPDVICLYKQLSASNCKPKDFVRGAPVPDKFKPSFYADKSGGFNPKMWRDHMQHWCEVDDQTADRWLNDRLEFNALMDKLSENKEYMCRMVFFSRKAAELVNYDNNFKIGEDTIQFMKLKKLAFEGELDMRRRNERKYGYTYIYTTDNSGVTEEGDKSERFDWIRPLTNHLNTLEGLIENQSLPEFRDHEI